MRIWLWAAAYSRCRAVLRSGRVSFVFSREIQNYRGAECTAEMQIKSSISSTAW